MANIPTPPNTGLLQDPVQRGPRTIWETIEPFVPPNLRGWVPSWEVSGKVPEYVGPQADMHWMVRDAKSGAENLRSGNIPQGLLDLSYAGAAIPMMLVPGTIGGARDAVRKGYQNLTNKKPDANPSAIRSEIKKQQETVLTPKELEKLSVLQKKHPKFSRASKFMLAEELRPMLANASSFNKMNRLLDVLPTAKNYAAVAKMGAPKQGWYRASTKALIDVFGTADAPRFASLLAATSPQTSVEMNLLNSLNIWRNWVAAGRPKDPTAIRRIMGDSVSGTKGQESVLDAWANNTVRALGSDNPANIVLSGPKVDSFYNNLIGDVWRVTNDAHMANISAIHQNLLRISPTEAQLLARNPGYSPAYTAMAARVREGGAEVGALPSEAQEQIWSVAMPLFEKQKADQLARDILQRGELTPDDIRGTPDFSTLLTQGDYARILDEAGYGEQLAKLEPHQWPTEVPNLSVQEQNEMMRAGERLEKTARLRASEAAAKIGWAPGKGYVYATAEAIPGLDTGIFPNIAKETTGKKDAFTGAVSSALTDDMNLDILHKSLGLSPIQTRPIQGAYRMDADHPIEFNKGWASGVEVDTIGRPGRESLRKRDEKKLVTAATLRGAMTGQHDSPYHGLLEHKTGVDLTVPRPKKLTETEIKNFADKYGLEDQAVVDTGKGVSLLNWTGTPYTVEQIEDIGGLLGSVKKAGKPKPPVRARNITDPDMNYVSLKDEWLQPPGTRVVTERMFNELKELSPSAFKRLDNVEVRQMAGDLGKLYRNRAKRTGDTIREDLLNMLDIVRDKGLAGLRIALDNKEFLPALGAIGLLPVVYQKHQQEAAT